MAASKLKHKQPNQSEQATINIIKELHKSRVVLEHAIHDYDGHRAAAVKDLGKAITQLRESLPEHHHHHVKHTLTIPAKKKTSTKETQDQSDNQLQQVRTQLKTVEGQLGNLAGSTIRRHWWTWRQQFNNWIPRSRSNKDSHPLVLRSQTEFGNAVRETPFRVWKMSWGVHLCCGLFGAILVPGRAVRRWHHIRLANQSFADGVLFQSTTFLLAILGGVALTPRVGAD